MTTENNHSNLIIKKELHQLFIEKKWNKTAGIVILVFSLIWTTIALFIGAGFVGSSIGSLFRGQFQAIEIITLFFGLIPLCFILLGVGLFITGIAMIANTSRIVLDGDLMMVSHGPIPVIRSRRLPKQAIKQIFVQEVSTNRTNADGKFQYRTPSNTSESFQLSYINQQNNIVPLFGKIFGLPVSMPTFNLKDAQLLETMFEEHFSIKDEAVLMEVNKPKNNGNKQIEKPKEEETYLEEEESPYHENEKPYFKETASPYHPNESPYKEEENKKLALIAAPGSFILEENMDGLFIFKKWRSPIVIFYIIFGTIWNAIIWTAASFIYPLLLSGNMELLIPALFMIPFLAVGIYIIYSAITIIFNTTTIHAAEEYLVIQNKPIPSGKNHRITVSDLLGFDIDKEKKSSKNGSYWVHTLVGILDNGSRVKLLGGHSFMSYSEEEINFLKNKLSQYIGLGE